ncbi:MAG: hypothetical protein H6867_02025 [Rhodospirillales bacterium]|nr:hypothetical protein [Rhodospirillales bacterium]MCB9996965.1 hypothetical protein [Rhodospirillales bacterium]
MLRMFMLAALVLFSFASQSWAACCPCPGCNQCVFPQRDATIAHIQTEHNTTRNFITQQFRFHQNWLFGANTFYGGARDSFFELHVLPALMMMTEQLVTTGMEQMFILGTFFDAKIQLETQRLFQEKEAEAHKDYHPSFGMCVIGTNVRSMAAADRNGEYTSYVLSQRSQDRQLGIYSGQAAYSAEMDRRGRIEQFKKRYCDTDNNSQDLTELCDAGKAPAATVNSDIDYMRTVDMNRTLNIDFTDDVATNDEIDVLALASNLFSHEVMNKTNWTTGEMESAEGPYLDLRSIVAKRSVAENSFNAIIGLKAQGTPISEQTILFTEKVLEQFGVNDGDDRLRMIGGVLGDRETPNRRPSYFAQLEVLAQKIYQDPEFYTNLYDKPANVQRKEVAMQAINLMLERDMYKNELRSEMALSIWLEMELMKYQTDIQNRLSSLKEKYEQN